MQIIRSQLSLVDQVYEAILGWIGDGKYREDARLIQEEIAEKFGVSRHPLQQALLLLRNLFVLINAPGRRLMVAPLEKEKMRGIYEIRASLDALASGVAAERCAKRARPGKGDHRSWLEGRRNQSHLRASTGRHKFPRFHL